MCFYSQFMCYQSCTSNKNINIFFHIFSICSPAYLHLKKAFFTFRTKHFLLPLPQFRTPGTLFWGADNLVFKQGITEIRHLITWDTCFKQLKDNIWLRIICIMYIYAAKEVSKIQEVQGVIDIPYHSWVFFWNVSQNIMVEKGRSVSNQENKLITDLKFCSSDAHTHAGCLCYTLEMLNTQLQQSENRTQNGKSGRGEKKKHKHNAHEI